MDVSCPPEEETFFGDMFYVQLRGTAMGANVTPTYANIFAAMLEGNIVYVSQNFCKVLRWWR